MKRSLSVGLLLLATGGCATMQSVFQKPTIHFRDARLSEISLGGATLELAFAIQNPNAIALDLAEVDVNFFVDERRVVTARPKDGVKLAARGESIFIFPATFSFSDVASVLVIFLTQDKATYRLDGNLGVETPVGRLWLPMKAEGSFDIPKLPEIELESPRIEDLSLSGATIALPLTLTNVNALPLPVERLQAALSIEGAALASVDVAEIKTLAPGTPRRLTVPIKIDFTQSLAAAQAIRKGLARFELGGTVTSGRAAIPFRVAEQLTLKR
jgi:LEA14-like dessication related protein